MAVGCAVVRRDVQRLKSADEVREFYSLGDLIGAGTYGLVRSAVSKEDGQEYALKTIKKARQQHYRREVLLSSRVKHPAVLSPQRVFETPDDVLMVTELCRGGELFEFVADHNMYLGTLDEEAVLEITREMLVAIEACHRAEFAHLDIKPENFVFRVPYTDILKDMRNVRNNLVLIDFGAAQPFRLRPYASSSAQYDKDMDEFFSGETSLGGTASYVSPEVLHGRFSSRSDLWSLGVTLFMLIAGRRPFDVNIDAQPSDFDRHVQENIKEEAALPLGTSLYSTCEELGLANNSTVDILLNMMHPEPILRKSATELIAEIDRMLEEEHRN
ncbi:Protein kinase, putative [Hondaea fermentalgiana]|uniref:Protein kinase, putative n=1 Tax=Hondaea fermentalgiana TaxID=2315210 RepID=A0A2R5GZ73_9STRA|nr:Protein kinase, putative [Hondaea fermentalgiana]|eukprot:GBG33771.1 Protein kinase, putative [Hondaea fermentalgiana]